MKFTETVRDNRSGETYEVSWGDNITDDMSLVSSLANVIAQQRARDRGEVQNFPGRFDTVSVRIEF